MMLSNHTLYMRGYNKRCPERYIWQGIKQRCTNPNSPGYTNYGARGVNICSRWAESFNNFLEDMGKRPSKDHSIDRIDNTKGYTPENCRWTTRTVQANNRRSSVRIEYKGEIHTLSEWSKIKGIRYKVFWQRLNRDNMSFDEAIK